VNPFHYGAPATGEHFLGRDSEIEALLTRMRSGVNVVLLSPRRYGKTSLLFQAMERLSHGRPKPAVVATNVFLCRDVATLASRLVSGAYQLPGARRARARQGIAEFLRRLRVRPTVELDDAGRPRFSFAAGLAAADADVVISDVFAILAAEVGRPAVLALDEFQAVTRHGEHLPYLFKGLSDEHPGVSLVLAGSQHHLMEKLVINEGAPLYGMAQRLPLGPIADELWMPFLETRAAGGGRPMEAGAAEAILTAAGPVPNDIQHLAFEAFEVASDRIGLAQVDAGMRQAVEHDSSLYAERMTLLSHGQLRVLVALAAGDTGPIFTGNFAGRVGLAGGQSVKKAIDALADDETVVLREGSWRVGDPFLAMWLREAT
jgi:hypothetical protein